MTTGNNIKLTRLQKGLTQTQLAQKIGKSTGYICAVEQGRLRLTLEKCSVFASALGVKVDAILGTDVRSKTIPITDDMTIGQKLRAYRANLQLTQEDLAKRMGYRTWGFISNIERGRERVTKAKLTRFANALGISPSDLADVDSVTRWPSRPPVIAEEMTQGERLREYRLSKGMTQKDLAYALGFNNAAFVCGIEKGKYRIPTQRIGQIAELLGISVDKLTCNLSTNSAIE